MDSGTFCKSILNNFLPESDRIRLKWNLKKNPKSQMVLKKRGWPDLRFRILLEKTSKSPNETKKNSFFLKKPFDPVPKIQKPSKDSSEDC